MGESEDCQVSWVSKAVAEVFVQCKCEVQRLPSNSGEDSSFWRVDNVCNDWSEAEADVTEGIIKESATSSSLLQWPTDDVQAIVDEAVFQHAVVWTLESGELWTRQQSDNRESVEG